MEKLGRWLSAPGGLVATDPQDVTDGRAHPVRECRGLASRTFRGDAHALDQRRRGRLAAHGSRMDRGESQSRMVEGKLNHGPSLTGLGDSGQDGPSAATTASRKRKFCLPKTAGHSSMVGDHGQGPSNIPGMNYFKYVLLVAVPTMASLLFGRPAQAGNPEAKERLAQKACLSGNYQKGVEILSDLYVSTKDPVYIYNQGRCFEQNGRCEDAILRFREYLRKAKRASDEEREEAEKHIAECRALPENKPAADAPKVEPAPVQQPAPVSPREVSPSSVLQPQPAPPEPAPSAPLEAHQREPGSRPGQGLRIVGIACGVLGIGSIATAVYFYTEARSYSDKVSKQHPVNPTDVSAGNNAETMQWVFYGIGGAALAAGTVLYVLGWRAGEGGHASVAPMVGPGVAGVSARGSF